MTATGTATAILEAARASIGMTEDPFGSNRQPFAACAGHANGYAWCLTWAVCMAKRAGVTLPRYDTAYTPTMADAFRADGRWGSTPSVGAFVFFQWPGVGRISHVGIVEAVRSDGAVVTIEGNTDEAGGSTGGKVMRHVRRANIAGYGYPRYGATPEDDMPLNDEDKKWIAAAIDARVDKAEAAMLNHYTLLMFGRPDPKGPDSPGHVGLRELRDQIAAVADDVNEIKGRASVSGDIAGDWVFTVKRPA